MVWDYLTKLLLRLLLSEARTLSGRVNIIFLIIIIINLIQAGWNWFFANLKDLYYYFVLIVFSAVMSDHTSRSKSRWRRRTK